MSKRILIINVNWVGDVLFSTPFIRAIRERYPDSYIACLLHPRCAEVLEDNPRLNEIIIYDEEGYHRSLRGKIRLIRLLRKKRFDTAFILHRSFTKAMIAFLAGARERIGYPTKNRMIFLTKPVEGPIEDIHKVEHFLNLAKAVGASAKDLAYEFFVRDSDRLYIREFLEKSGSSGKGPIVVICPGGNWGPKRWPKEKFARLSDALAEEFRATVTIAGAKKDIALAEEIRAMMRNKSVIACGKTTLKQLGALFEKADLVIANDTGPMHLAVSMKARVIALFGPTSPEITGPYGRGDYKVIFNNQMCIVPCYDVTCHKNRCMDAIDVEDVLRESRLMLAKSPKLKAQSPNYDNR